MKKSKQIIPKWFKGTIYKKGAKVQNPFSGETCKLNGKELSMYDFVVGANLYLEHAHDNNLEPTPKLKKITQDLYKGLDWFRDNNAKAYMVLLD